MNQGETAKMEKSNKILGLELLITFSSIVILSIVYYRGSIDWTIWPLLLLGSCLNLYFLTSIKRNPLPLGGG